MNIEQYEVGYETNWDTLLGAVGCPQAGDEGVEGDSGREEDRGAEMEGERWDGLG